MVTSVLELSFLIASFAVYTIAHKLHMSNENGIDSIFPFTI
jgi:hypothetical protein